MITKFITTVFLALLYCQMMALAQLHQTDLQKAHLKGKVKKIVTVVGNQSPKEDNYNEQGNLISEIEEYMNETTKKEYVYNKNGLKTEEKEFNNDDKPESRLIVKYDTKNNPVSETSYNNIGKVRFQSSFQNVYNKKGWLMQVTEKTTLFDEYGKVQSNWTTIIKYDEKGRTIEQTRKEKGGKTVFQLKNKFDNNGTVVEKTEKNEWKTTITRSFPKYNEYGKIEENILYINVVNSNKTDTITEKNYYGNNKLIKKIIQNTGTLWTENYDENELLISQQIGDDLYITFKYDKDGNWIEQVSTNSNKTFNDRYGNPLVVSSFREIEYY
ncbi:MAG: hypothetical protein WBC06_09800 [Chitinophagaceae bacterium]